MLRQLSSEVMDRTCTRPPYALHVGQGVFQTIGYPPNWLFSCPHDNVASVQTIGETCIVNMANRLTGTAFHAFSSGLSRFFVR